MDRHGNITTVRGRHVRLSGVPAAAPPDPNLLAGLPWVQGTGTLMTKVGAEIRAQNNGGNPRVYKAVTGLIVGRTYSYEGNVYAGTGTGQNMFVRVSTAPDLPSGDIAQFTTADTGFIQDSFVHPGGTVYVGLVAIRDPGQYAAIEDAFKLLLT